MGCCSFSLFSFRSGCAAAASGPGSEIKQVLSDLGECRSAPITLFPWIEKMLRLLKVHIKLTSSFIHKDCKNYTQWRQLHTLSMKKPVLNVHSTLEGERLRILAKCRNGTCGIIKLQHSQWHCIVPSKISDFKLHSIQKKMERKKGKMTVPMERNLFHHIPP